MGQCPVPWNSAGFHFGAFRGEVAPPRGILRRSATADRADGRGTPRSPVPAADQDTSAEVREVCAVRGPRRPRSRFCGRRAVARLDARGFARSSDGKRKTRFSLMYRAKRVFLKWSPIRESNVRVLSPISTCFQSVAKTCKVANFQPSLPPHFISHLRCGRSDGNELILNLLHFRSPPIHAHPQTFLYVLRSGINRSAREYARA